MRKYVNDHHAAGKSTKVLTAALIFRLDFCENRNFDFKRLAKGSENKRPHKAITNEELNDLYLKLKPYPRMNVACRILLDMGARVQDLVKVKFDSFTENRIGQGTFKWEA